MAMQIDSDYYNNNTSMNPSFIDLNNNNNNDTIDSNINETKILCCLCGTPIVSNPANMCLNCLKSQVDITDGIQKQGIIFWCRNCGRYQKPPFMNIELESPEMLSLCIKKIKGLNINSVKLVNAVFVYTEPHSRRIKLKLTIQKELFVNSILQQSFIVEFIIQNLQCEQCQKSFTEHTWKANLQLRQFVKHKRTFYYVEQLLIKHNTLLRNIIEIKENNKNGLDFFYGKRSNAQQLYNFLSQIIPCRNKLSKKLISQNDNSNTYNYKYTIYVEIVPICKYDLCLITNKQLLSKLGNLPNSLLLCHKVTNTIQLIDPLTLKLVDINSKIYYDFPFTSIATQNELIEFVVLDINVIDSLYAEQQYNINDMRAFNRQNSTLNNKLQLASVTVAKASDFGNNDTVYENIITHLGSYLNEGDSVLGYDLNQINFSDLEDQLTDRVRNNLPEIVLVKKHYPNAKERQRQRKFELRRLKKLEKQENDKINKRNNMQVDDNDEYEKFIQDIEEDKEMQQKINLYKKQNNVIVGSHNNRNQNHNHNYNDDVDIHMNDDNDGEYPEIDVDQLLDGLNDVNIDESNIQYDDESEVDDDPNYALANDNDIDNDIDNQHVHSTTSTSKGKNNKRGRR